MRFNNCCRIIFTLLLLVLTRAEVPASAGVLSKFKETRITVDAHPELDKFGMTKNGVRNHVAHWLRVHLPGLEVKDSVAPFIHVSVLLEERSGNTHGYLNLRVVREVTILGHDQIIFGGVWQTGGLVASQLSQTQTFVIESLEQLLTKFANQWERDNP